MAIEKIPENWYIGGPTYPSSFTKDRLTLIQTVNYLTGKIQECIETINAVDPTQVNEFIALVNQLNEAVTQLTSEVNAATETANNASQTATSAKQTADGLAGEIAQANTTANEAKSTADSASTTAQGASSKADNAVTVAGEANGKSDNSVQIANAATVSANEAKVAAQAAQNSATSALTNASTALSTANQALTKSETAIGSAETANDTANAAKATADSVSSTAQGAVDTANEAKSTADAASAKVDSFVPGHTIVNSSGGNLPTRNKLQFKGAVVSDNDGGDSTIVEIPGGVINSETVVAFSENQFIVQKDNKAQGVTPTPDMVGFDSEVINPTKGPAIGSNYSKAYRYGRICFVYVSLGLTEKPDAFSRTTVLLSGLPVPAMEIGSVCYDQNTGLSNYMQLTNSGELKLFVSSAGFPGLAPFLWGSFCYLTAE